jgi:hypothetical protein
MVKRTLFQRPPSPWHAVLVLLASAAFLCLLFVPAADPDTLGVSLDWRPEIEPLLLIAVLAVLALAGRRLPRTLRWAIAVLVFLAALLQAADVLVLRILDRPLDLYFDLAQAPHLVALFYDAAGFWRGAAALVLAGLAALALVAVIAQMLAACERMLRPPVHAAVTLGLVLVLVIAAPVARLAHGEPVLGLHTAQAISADAARAWRSYAVMHGDGGRYAAALAAPQPPMGALPGLKGRDVYIVFFESYGTVVLDDPRYSGRIVPALAQFAQEVEGAGWHLLSNRIVSPTFGGGSWLAHGTIESGIKLDLVLDRLITRSRRQTLARYLRAAGYRSIEVMPGTKTPAEGYRFWGFERSIYAADLGYDGPAFGWFRIPDQYTLRRFDETEAAAGHGPLFAQIVLVSSHTPFAPLPPYVADWGARPLYGGISPAQRQHIAAPPDWSHLEIPYADSIVYDLRTLGAWLARRPGDALVVILGDHQPPSFVSGEKQPWTVPIHVLSRDPDLLRPFRAQGYVDGPLPPRDGAFKGMESFLGDFITGFAAPPPAAHADARQGRAD